MASQRRIRIMLSSRCNTPVRCADGSTLTLTALRRQMRDRLEALKLGPRALFEVWISEDPEAPAALESSWEVCMSQVRDCHLLFVLLSGEAGWARAAGDIGICHAELQTAMAGEPGKVFLLDLSRATQLPPPADAAEKARNTRFAAYAAQINRFRERADTAEQALQRIEAMAAEAVLRFVDLGKREAQRGQFNSGVALDWSRMSYLERKAAIEASIAGQLAERDAPDSLRIAGSRIRVVVNAIPAGMAVAAARELVGQPFLRDHDALPAGAKWAGPLHIIGVHKGCSEAQAMRQLGFADATFVEAPFGVFVADQVQKIQIALLRNCRDEASTRHNVQRLLDWVEETGEAHYIAARAQARARIVAAIRKEAADT